MIVASVNWYLRYSLSLRDVEELLIERGVSADHTTVWRWVQRYAPELRGVSADHTTVWRWVQRYAPELEKRCARGSSRPTRAGGWTRPTSGSRENGLIFTGRW